MVTFVLHSHSSHRSWVGILLLLLWKIVWWLQIRWTAVFRKTFSSVLSQMTMNPVFEEHVILRNRDFHISGHPRAIKRACNISVVSYPTLTNNLKDGFSQLVFGFFVRQSKFLEYYQYYWHKWGLSIKIYM